MEEKQVNIEIYFKKEYNLAPVIYEAKYVSSLDFRSNFLRIHNKKTEGWDYFSIDSILLIRYPDHPI